VLPQILHSVGMFSCVLGSKCSHCNTTFCSIKHIYSDSENSSQRTQRMAFSAAVACLFLWLLIGSELQFRCVSLVCSGLVFLSVLDHDSIGCLFCRDLSLDFCSQILLYLCWTKALRNMWTHLCVSGWNCCVFKALFCEAWVEESENTTFDIHIIERSLTVFCLLTLIRHTTLIWAQMIRCVFIRPDVLV